jgi:hypothetical protein
MLHLCTVRPEINHNVIHVCAIVIVRGIHGVPTQGDILPCISIVVEIDPMVFEKVELAILDGVHWHKCTEIVRIGHHSHLEEFHIIVGPHIH